MKNQPFYSVLLVCLPLLALSLALASCKNPTDGTPTYTITFDANGGSGAVPSPITVESGSRVSLPGGSGLSKTGYTFSGWNTRADGTGSNYSAGSSYMTGNDVTLYARWNVITYTVAYNKNAADATGTMASSIHTYDADKNLNPNTFTRTGYIFMGWARTTSGTVEFADGANIINLTSTTGETVMLYAVWIDGSTVWTVRFETDGGSVVGNVIILKDTPVSRPTPDPVRTGYTFDNWFDSELTIPHNFSSIITSNTTLYAKWNPIAYTVAYDKNAADAIGDMINSSHIYDVDATLDNNVFTRTGYTFAGWAKTSVEAVVFFDGQSVRNLSVVAGDTVTLYAKWNPITYTVAYDKNAADAIGDMANSSHVYDVDKNLTANAFNRIGYTFAGWSKASDGAVDFSNGASVRNLTSTTGAIITLYAQWTLQYTVNFNHDSGMPAPPQQFIEHGGKVSEPTAMTRTGYTFGGWYKESSFTNQWNFASDTVTSIITLYAKWIPNSAGITFDVKQITEGTPTINVDISISRTNNGYPITYPVSVNASDYDAGSIRWEVAGVGIYTGQTVTGNGATFTLNAAEVRYNSLGGHALILTVAKGGQQYQRAIPFTIVQ